MTDPTPDRLHELVIEADRGYCTEHLGANRYCLQPAITVLVGTQELLLCEQHRKGYPWRLR